MVTIEMIELSTNKRNVLGDGLAPNIGNFSMDRLSHRIHRGNPGKRRIQISNAYDDSKKIKSKKFLIKTNRLESAYSEQELYYDKREDVGIRDILRRLTVVERENKQLRKALKRDDNVLEDKQFAEASACQGIVEFDSSECEDEPICRSEGQWVYGESEVVVEMWYINAYGDHKYDSDGNYNNRECISINGS
jgi:hypothetical protein